MSVCEQCSSGANYNRAPPGPEAEILVHHVGMTTRIAIGRLVAGAWCVLAAALLTAAQPPAINSADPGSDSARQTPVGG